MGLKYHNGSNENSLEQNYYETKDSICILAIRHI